MIRIPLAAIAEATCMVFDIQKMALTGVAKTRLLCDARFAAIVVMKELRPDRGWKFIGRFLERDHTTIIHGHRRGVSLVASDAGFAAKVEAIKQICASWRPGEPLRPLPEAPATHAAESEASPPAAIVGPAMHSLDDSVDQIVMRHQGQSALARVMEGAR